MSGPAVPAAHPAPSWDGLPPPGDPGQAKVGLERWRETVARLADADVAQRAAALTGFPAGRRILEAIFGNSPFLSHCALQEPALVASLLQDGPDSTIAEIERDLNDELAGADRKTVMRRLRQARRRHALTIAIADIAGLWSVEAVTGALSRFIDRTLAVTTAHLLAEAWGRGRLPVPRGGAVPERSGWVILAMGKHGAMELNYSSDIDLIVLYDADRYDVPSVDLHQPFVRLTRDLVSVLQERTADGYVARVDLRLRPDPGATPVAMSCEAALGYYESLAQNWERAAMIKARPVGPDIAAGKLFLRHLRPFVWRRNLDFPAIEDIHAMKRQIGRHRGGRHIRLDGHNLKLGRGGIREIEFFAQTQQLIWGGREPSLRVPGTVPALTALAAADRITPETADDMARCYVWLRRVEHRIQMVDDQQTHALPADADGRARLSRFLGYPDPAAFDTEIGDTLHTVERHYADLFEDSPELGGPGNLVFTGSEPDPDTVRTLAGLGYREAGSVFEVVQAWHRGRYRATRSERARQMLTALMPALIARFGETADPDAALRRLDAFLRALPAGVQLFSLLQNNPALLKLLATIMGSAPQLAAELGRHPGLLDAVLGIDFYENLPDAAALTAQLDAVLADALDYEDVLDRARRWAGEQRFRVGVLTLEAPEEAARHGEALAAIAEAVLAALWPRVEAAFAERHGRVPGGAFAVLAMGRFGSGRMSFSSDLDLVFIYEVAGDGRPSDGERPLEPATYMTRLAQRLIAAVTALTAEGRLYEIDMRLRPSGNAGPIAISLPGFVSYHQDSAWTWEHMALTRARVVIGDARLSASITAAVRSILTRPRDPDALVVEVDAMRERIAREHRTESPWQLKHARGGLVDIEFIAQYLELRHGAVSPSVLRVPTDAALAALVEAGHLDTEAGDALQRTLALAHALQGLLRLTVGDTLDERAVPRDLVPLLVRAGGAVDFDGLASDIEAALARSHAQYRRLVAEPAARVGTETQQTESG